MFLLLSRADPYSYLWLVYTGSARDLEQQRWVCGAILSFVLFQGLLNASLECEDAAEGVNEALSTCQTKCPVVLLSAAVTDPILVLWFWEKSSTSSESLC